jgi:hypothetical protein
MQRHRHKERCGIGLMRGLIAVAQPLFFQKRAKP